MKATTVVLAVALTCVAASARADQPQVAAGTTYALGSGRTQLNCGTLTANGTLQGQTGTGAGLGSAKILGGLLHGDAATFLASGTWNNGGTFDAGAGTADDPRSLLEIAEGRELRALLRRFRELLDLAG